MNPYLFDRRDDGEGHWSERALCAQVDGDMWFPEKGDKGGTSKPAKEVCEVCEVRTQCLADALALAPEEDRYGIRGGLSERERRQLRKAPAA